MPKLERLKVERHVFTESEIDSVTQVKQIEEAVKKRHLQEEMSKLKAMHARNILQNKGKSSVDSHSSTTLSGMNIT